MVLLEYFANDKTIKGFIKFLIEVEKKIKI
jgi:hypothetical protein